MIYVQKSINWKTLRIQPFSMRLILKFTSKICYSQPFFCLPSFCRSTTNRARFPLIPEYERKKGKLTFLTYQNTNRPAFALSPRFGVFVLTFFVPPLPDQLLTEAGRCLSVVLNSCPHILHLSAPPSRQPCLHRARGSSPANQG